MAVGKNVPYAVLKIQPDLVDIIANELNPVSSSPTTDAGESSWNRFWDAIGGVFDGLLGIFLNFFNLIPIMIAGIFQMMAAAVANIGGGQIVFLTIEDILFNKVPILNVNFFNTSGNEVITNIRNNIASWYVALRNIAIILSLVVLIYVGIRMALSTVAEDKAKYKKMLTDWVVGFITIFLLHYIIVIVLNVNDLLVNVFAGSPVFNTSSYGFESFMGDLAFNALPGQKFTVSLTSTIIFVMLVVMTIMFLITYMKRMLTVAFLIITAPIITVTYSIDKMGDRKITSTKYLVKRVYI